ncbi:hypothetical protein [Roseimarinus sediminis]|uniref:hypothetical protein n=1 Tax=Roseimarinus sediminis TaxID=1610899 RepID=UPI003D20B654
MGEKERLAATDEQIFSEFIISDEQLGLFESEMYDVEKDGVIDIIAINRLEMILELSRKRLAN